MAAKQNRTSFSAAQNEALREAFSRNSSPGPSEMKGLASRLNLREAVVKTWFKNHRARLKRQQSKSQSNQSPGPSEQAKLEENVTPESRACPCAPSSSDDSCAAPETPGVARAPELDVQLGLPKPKLHRLWPPILFDIDTLVMLYALPGEDDPESFQVYLEPDTGVPALNSALDSSTTSLKPA